jgi:peptidoglycan/xylan/chitin deacetylase (PgdA/CDA1 family)
MPGRALILTYHGIEPGAGPLWIDPGLFREHLDCLRDCGARAMTLSELATGLATGALPPLAVAITFDDGLSSVGDTAAALLAERSMPATVFCVAGRLGGDNRWPAKLPGGPRRPLASPGDLARLAADGFEIGAHGMEHLPLRGARTEDARREIVDARHVLEQQVGVKVTSFAYPYGAMPSAGARALVASTYPWAVTTRAAYATASSPRSELPRVDIHYLRRPAMLRRAAEGSLEGYLGLRRRAAWVRRLVISDHIGGRRAAAPGSSAAGPTLF